MDPAVMITSSAQPWSLQVMIVEVDLWGWYVGLQPRLPIASHLRRGYMKSVKRKGDSVSPWSVPLQMESGAVLPWMDMQYALKPEYRCIHVLMSESWNQNSFISQQSTRWSIPPKASFESEQAVYMFRFKICASSYIMICVERLSYMLLWDRNSSAVSLKMPSDSVVWVLMLVRMDVQNLNMQFISAMGL